jgi:hypothetical protein
MGMPFDERIKDQIKKNRELHNGFQSREWPDQWSGPQFGGYDIERVVFPDEQEIVDPE